MDQPPAQAPRCHGRDDESVREQADQALFNKIAEHYCRKDLHTSSMVARRHRLRRTLSSVPIGRAPRVLEVGCGAGFSVRYLEGLFGEFCGVDYADELVRYARQHNSAANVRFESCNVKSFCPAEPFDLVFMIGVLHHFDEPEAVLARIRQMVRPGGWIVANEPQSCSPVVQVARRIRSRVDGSYSSDQVQFTPGDLRALFERVGLQRVSVTPQGVFSTPFAEVVLQPQFLSAAASYLAVAVDSVLEATLGRLITPLSWNAIVAGQVPADA